MNRLLWAGLLVACLVLPSQAALIDYWGFRAGTNDVVAGNSDLDVAQFNAHGGQLSFLGGFAIEENYSLYLQTELGGRLTDWGKYEIDFYYLRSYQAEIFLAPMISYQPREIQWSGFQPFAEGGLEMGWVDRVDYTNYPDPDFSDFIGLTSWNIGAGLYYHFLKYRIVFDFRYNADVINRTPSLFEQTPPDLQPSRFRELIFLVGMDFLLD